jgi:hypothetical protein
MGINEDNKVLRSLQVIAFNLMFLKTIFLANGMVGVFLFGHTN